LKFYRPFVVSIFALLGSICWYSRKWYCHCCSWQSKLIDPNLCSLRIIYKPIKFKSEPSQI
jgi:hypothetical protein